MCGIVGIVGKRAERFRENIIAMRDAIAYRGPDEVGEYYFKNCALGHVRLSIVDLAGGQQPMIRDNGNLGLVFNGEIYGYQSIRNLVVRGGGTLSSNSDTEVILSLYQHYGEDMMRHLPGMFAFALWDEYKQRLFCARDRFGEKPFYYAMGQNGEFVFASEIKGILASGLVEPILDTEQVWHYLNYSYVYPTRTIYKNIFILPPAHTLIFENGTVNISRYYNLPQTNLAITEAEAVEEFRRLFRQAVKRQLVADVPVGAFLSGGLDSGSVVATAAELVEQVTTISFAFPDGIDESKAARSMADRYHTNHIELRATDYDIVELLHTMQHIFDEPFADPAAIPAYLIAKAAREHVKVVLTGDAGDELLGGYDRNYRALKYMREYQQSIIPQQLLAGTAKAKFFVERVLRKLKKITGIQSFEDNLLYNTSLRDTEIRMIALAMLHDNPTDIVDYCRSKSRMINNEQMHMLGLSAPRNDYHILEGFLEPSELENALRVDLLDYLPGNGFLKTDRTTMAVSLESRTPFCDVDLAEFCISLPFDMKVRGRLDKYILRKAMEDKWTEPVRRGAKNGFSPPFGKWLENPKVQDMQEYYLNSRDRRIFNVLDFAGMRKFMATANTWPRYSMLMLSMFLEHHPWKLE